MKIDIIIAYLKRYEFGHEKDFVPPITGIHLAALTPKGTDNPEELLIAHRNLWKRTFSFSYSVKRIFRGLRTLSSGAFFMSFFMNSFYMTKKKYSEIIL